MYILIKHNYNICTYINEVFFEYNYSQYKKKIKSLLNLTCIF